MGRSSKAGASTGLGDLWVSAGLPQAVTGYENPHLLNAISRPQGVSLTEGPRTDPQERMKTRLNLEVQQPHWEARSQRWTRTKLPFLMADIRFSDQVGVLRMVAPSQTRRWKIKSLESYFTRPGIFASCTGMAGV